MPRGGARTPARRGGGGSNEGNPGCSGPAASLGISARVGIGFCEGRACSIVIEHVPRANWSGVTLSLKATLEAKYGRVARLSAGRRDDTESAALRLLYRRPVTAPNLGAL